MQLRTVDEHKACIASTTRPKPLAALLPQVGVGNVRVWRTQEQQTVVADWALRHVQVLRRRFL